MKKFLFTLTVIGALALGSQSASAQATKKKKETPAPAPATPTAEKTPGSTNPVADTAKPKTEGDAVKARNLPFHSVVDSIDASGKSFSHKNKDGKEVKNMVTAKTELKNGEKDAKFEDIKVGDEVKGMRMKKSDTEYEVVKTTYIGAPEKKAAPATKAGDAPKTK